MTAAANENLVELERLTKRFAFRQGVFARGTGEVHAVEGVSLTVFHPLAVLLDT